MAAARQVILRSATDEILSRGAGWLV